jgi:hypothetical protein
MPGKDTRLPFHHLSGKKRGMFAAPGATRTNQNKERAPYFDQTEALLRSNKKTHHTTLLLSIWRNSPFFTSSP